MCPGAEAVRNWPALKDTARSKESRAFRSVWWGGKGTEFGRKALPQAPNQGTGHVLKTCVYFTPISVSNLYFGSVLNIFVFLSQRKNPSFPKVSGFCTDTSATQRRVCHILKSSETSSGRTRPRLAGWALSQRLPERQATSEMFPSWRPGPPD